MGSGAWVAAGVSATLAPSPSGQTPTGQTSWPARPLLLLGARLEELVEFLLLVVRRRSGLRGWRRQRLAGSARSAGTARRRGRSRDGGFSRRCDWLLRLQVLVHLLHHLVHVHLLGLFEAARDQAGER